MTTAGKADKPQSGKAGEPQSGKAGKPQSGKAGKPQSGPAKRACPICRRPSDGRYRPFCSRRCADADLSRWLEGAYRIPASEEDDAGNADEEPEAR